MNLGQVNIMTCCGVTLKVAGSSRDIFHLFHGNWVVMTSHYGPKCWANRPADVAILSARKIQKELLYLILHLIYLELTTKHIKFNNSTYAGHCNQKEVHLVPKGSSPDMEVKREREPTVTSTVESHFKFCRETSHTQHGHFQDVTALYH